MKILLSAYSCSPGRGSEPGVGWNWAVELARKGNDVWVLTRAKNRSAIEGAMPSLRIPGKLNFLYHDLAKELTGWKAAPLGDNIYYSLWQRTAFKMARVAHEKHRFDVVHHLTWGSWRQPSFLHLLGIPFIIGPLGGGEMAPKELVRKLPLRSQFFEATRVMSNRLALRNPSVLASLRCADLVIAKTVETKRWIKRAGRTAEVALEIGIETQALRQDKGRNARSELRCIFAGRLIGWKGSLLALSAVKVARNLGAQVSLTIVGEGSLATRLASEIKKQRLGKWVRLVGPQSRQDLFSLFRASDVLLFPSLHDSSGNVVLEALANGLPVVCLDLGGPAVIVNDSSGLVIETSDSSYRTVIQRLSEALVKLHIDRDLLARLSIGARERASAMTWEAVVDRIYGRFLGQSNHPAG